MKRRKNLHAPGFGKGRGAHGRSPMIGAADLHDFSGQTTRCSTRTERRSRGVVSQVMPTTSSAESDAAYSRRSSQAGYVQRSARRNRRRRLLGFAVAAVAVVALAVGVSSCVFSSAVSGKMAIDSAAKAALTAPSDATDPQYVLLVGDYSDNLQVYDGPGAIILARIEPQNDKVTFLSIPSSTQVTLSDGKTHKISEAEIVGGDAELISAVSNLTGFSVAHFVKTDATGFQDLVNALGGVEVDVSQECDDPDTGDIYIPAGRQTLDGAQALTLCRGNNYSDGNATRSKVQMAFLEAMAGKAFSTSGFDSAAAIDAVSGSVKTDLSVNDALALMAALGDMADATVYQAVLPGAYYSSSGSSVYYISSSSWPTMKASIDAGNDPAALSAAAAAVNPNGVTVTVRNGSTIVGAASEAASILQAKGYTISATGNADSQVYTDTLVVYGSTDKKATAEAIVGTLGQGRVVSASIYYSFDTDILVVVGSSWKPTS